jgi:hypothetical protein
VELLWFDKSPNQHLVVSGYSQVGAVADFRWTSGRLLRNLFIQFDIKERAFGGMQLPFLFELMASKLLT